MHFTSLLSTLLFALTTSPVRAQTASDIVNALRGAGLTSLADALSNVTDTDVGKNVISQLTSGGNYTVFAPTNAAFNNPSIPTLADTPDKLASILSYHVVQGNFVNNSGSNGSPEHLSSATFPSVIVGRTLLTSNGSESFVNLEAGKGQVLVWSNNATSTTRYFLNQSPEITVANATAVTSSILVAPISGVLIPPSNLSTVLKAYPDEASSISGIVSITNSESGGGSIVQRLESNQTRGFTLFAPNNDAIRAAGDAVTSLGSNETALEIVIGNHYVNGSTFYSPQITSDISLVSASGQDFSFSTNSTGTFVTSSNVTAKIVKTDILAENGVVHFIDAVLVNLNVNQEAAQSAYASATSTAAAGASSTATGPIAAATQTNASGSGNGNGNGGNGGNGASSILASGNWALQLSAGLILFTAMFTM